MPHYHFIVNPAAGGNISLHRFHVVEMGLAKLGVEYSTVYSEYPGHATELARQALTAGHEIVVAAGGDGTVREVAQELVHQGVVMGILPLGTGNDLARALRIPREPDLALRVLLNGDTRWIDTLQVNGQLCLNVAGLGFDVEVLEKTQRYKNRFHGRLAYLLGVLHALADLRSHRVRITTNRGVLEEDVLLATVGNGTHIGGGMMVTPLADPSDGLMDLCVVRRVGRLKVLHCLARFIRGGHLGVDIVHYSQTDSVDVECDEGALIQMDGEIIGSTPASIRLQRRSLQVVAGEGKSWNFRQLCDDTPMVDVSE